MKTKSIYWVSAAVLAFVIGCSSTSHKEFTGDAYANVRFAFLGAYGLTHVRTFKYETIDCDDEDNWLTLSRSTILNGRKKNLGIPLNSFSSSEAKEIKMQTDREMTFLFKSYSSKVDGQYSTIMHCGVPIKIEFKEGQSYELLFIEPVLGKCQVEISKIVKHANGYEREKLSRFTNEISEEFSECKSAFEKLRWL